jgi:hypothetical protein
MDPANPSTPPVRQSPPPSVADPNDKRTLFDKLAEVKAKKQEAFEEATKFSTSLHDNLIKGNLIKRLDDDESDFLTSLQSELSKEERAKRERESQEINAFRKSFPQLCFRRGCGDVLSIGPKVRLSLFDQRRKLRRRLCRQHDGRVQRGSGEFLSSERVKVRGEMENDGGKVLPSRHG